MGRPPDDPCNVSFESMGFKTFGFAGGREDVYEPTDINWGPETEWLADERFSADGKLKEEGLGASQMGLIYVNPEGPNGKPDPKAAAEHIRITFGRMGMNDEETVALIGGHTLGKAHGASRAAKHVGVEPEGAPLEAQGFGWKIRTPVERAPTPSPVDWKARGPRLQLRGPRAILEISTSTNWKLITGPGGAKQWEPTYGEANVPDAHIEGKMHKPMMLTTDLALKEDPAYGKISKRFYENPAEFDLAFAKAWFKLTHRDMGPTVACLDEVPPARMAGPSSGRGSRSCRRCRSRRTQGIDLRFWSDHSTAGQHCLGIGINLSRHR